MLVTRGWCCTGAVTGVAQIHDVVFVVCRSSAVLRFNATTRQRLSDITFMGLREPFDIAACEQSSALYVAVTGYFDFQKFVWRVSADGSDIKRWLTAASPHKLSVTSTRLLVTSQANRQLTQYDDKGNELGCIQLPDDVKLEHAVESQTGTFIVR